MIRPGVNVGHVVAIGLAYATFESIANGVGGLPGAVWAGAGAAVVGLIIGATASRMALATDAAWLPETGRFEPGRRRDALRRATPYRRIVLWIVLLVSVSAVCGPTLASLRERGGAIALLVGLATVLAAPAAAAAYIVRKRIRRGLREQLAAQGMPICIECGEELPAGNAERCPECGAPSLTTGPSSAADLP